MRNGKRYGALRQEPLQEHVEQTAKHRRRKVSIKARQGKFIYKAQFVHKAIQRVLQLYKIRRRQIKSFHKKIK